MSSEIAEILSNEEFLGADVRTGSGEYPVSVVTLRAASAREIMPFPMRARGPCRQRNYGKNDGNLITPPTHVSWRTNRPQTRPCTTDTGVTLIHSDALCLRQQKLTRVERVTKLKFLYPSIS